MCGFAGFVDLSNCVADPLKVADRMGNAIIHRGPDDGGVWSDHELPIYLVHRRLSILDTSQSGHQPMVSASGRYTLVFNGEIYNHLDLRKKLEVSDLSIPMWQGRSDTETVLACLEAWGVDEAIPRLIGMFAMAIWDRRLGEVALIRDRMGEKPLYYGVQGTELIFGSELKALKAHPSFVGHIDRSSLALQMRHGYIPAPYSIYKDIYKLPPGHCLKIRCADRLLINKPEPYWSFASVVVSGLSIENDLDEISAVTKLDELLRLVVAGQMLSDVPLGAFLSGGIDSSVIVALMQAQSMNPIKTFTIGFSEAGYNEAEQAKAVSKHLGTDHTELYVQPADALDVIPKLPSIYDEPFSDSSQIPTYLVSGLTRRYVSVSLSGDAGDELFGGYSRYVTAQSLWRGLNRIPRSARSLGAKSIAALSPSLWDLLAAPVKPLLPFRMRNVGDKAHKVADLISPRNRSEFYRAFVSHWSNPCDLVINGDEHETQITSPQLDLADMLQQMMALDSLSYLPDDILCKVDRAAMAVSLETRVPFLDHRVVELAWQFPPSMKIRNGETKWVLRQLLNKYVPKELYDRPKMGFGVPIGSWLRGPLRDWAESLLDERRLRDEGFFYVGPIRQKWEEHIAGKRNWQYHLWDVLMFQAWLEQSARE